MQVLNGIDIDVRRGERVAIVGAGYAGLSAAVSLAQRGVHVTVTLVLPRVTLGDVGESGTVRGIPVAVVPWLIPAADRATTEIE